MEKVFYLGKDGEQFGPFTEQDLQRMQQDGSLHSYVWLWDSSLNSWQPIQTPPPVPAGCELGTENEVIAQSFAPAEHSLQIDEDTEAARPVPEAESSSLAKFEVLCFNRKHYIPSQMIHASDKSWHVRSKQPIRGRSPFECRSEIKLMIFTPEKNESEIATGKVVASQKHNGFWLYEIEFAADPSQPGAKKTPKIAS